MKHKFEFTVKNPKTGRLLKTKKQYVASSEAEARELAEESGYEVVGVTILDFWTKEAFIHGVSFKNIDNVRRYDIIEDCSVGDEVVLEHESGNRDDQNAIRVLDKRGRQMGYLTPAVASRIMDWYEPSTSPVYSARVIDIRKWDRGAKPRLRMVLAMPSASDDAILEFLKTNGVKKPSKHLPRRVLKSKPRITKASAVTSDSRNSGCLLLVLLMFAVLAVVLCS